MPSDQSHHAISTSRAAAIAFAVAFSTLLLQLVQTRIFSVVYWNHLVYFIVTIALLGFGISGTILTFADSAVWRKFLSLRTAAVLFVFTALVSSLVVPRLAVTMETYFTGLQQARLFLTYGVAVLPYFFGGWILGSLFRDRADRIHLLYFVDLVGAGLGCLAYVGLMQRVGAVNLVALACLITLLPVLVDRSKGVLSHAVSFACMGLLAFVSYRAGDLSASIIPEKTKAFNANWQELSEDDEKVVEYSQWNTISRIDVARARSNPNDRRIYIDGDAWTGIVVPGSRSPEPFNFSTEAMNNHKLPYILHRDSERTLVIGSGGGIDVWFALRSGAKEIDAIEINPTTYHLLKHKFSKATGGIFNLENVHALNEEGRSFVRRSDDAYDVIMLHGIDTFAALSAGAYVLSENYLYTVDALKDYIEHLKPRGSLCITRWNYPPEAMRLFTVALEALYELGVDEPEKCIIAESSGWMTVLVRKTPFSAEDVETVRRVAGRSGGEVVFPVTDDVTPHDSIASQFQKYAELRAQNEEKSFVRDYPWSIEPVWDDSPFFFNYDKFASIRSVLGEKDAGNLIRGHWASFTLYALLGLAIVAVFIFMFAPLLWLGRANLRGFGYWIVFFGCLGTGYMFVEIALMQRFALLLGHPSRSLALVLGTLLISTGIGSLISSRLTSRFGFIFGAVVFLILSAGFVYPSLSIVLLGLPLPARSLCTILLVAPLGIVMGMPFPIGVRCISQENTKAIPWMWAVNGGTSVLGSVLAVVLAIHFNFTTVFVAAALGYVCALVFLTKLRRGAVV